MLKLSVEYQQWQKAICCYERQQTQLHNRQSTNAVVAFVTAAAAAAKIPNDYDLKVIFISFKISYFSYRWLIDFLFFFFLA